MQKENISKETAGQQPARENMSERSVCVTGCAGATCASLTHVSAGQVDRDIQDREVYEIQNAETVPDILREQLNRSRGLTELLCDFERGPRPSCRCRRGAGPTAACTHIPGSPSTGDAACPTRQDGLGRAERACGIRYVGPLQVQRTPAWSAGT